MAALELTLSELIAGIPSTVFCVWYVLKKHWLANNILGISFAIEVSSLCFKCILYTIIFTFVMFSALDIVVQGIELLSLGSFKIGAILLVSHI